MRLLVFAAICVSACATPDPCAELTPNGNPFVTEVPDGLMAQILAEPTLSFPPSFAFGAATASYQVESGNDASDWALWEDLGRISGDDVANDGPAHDRYFAEDVERMRGLGLDSYRLSIEWGRLFPTRAQFDALEVDPLALAYYSALLDTLVANGIKPMVTLHHFTLPAWLQAPPAVSPAGLLEPEYPALLAKFAEWAGAEFGDRVDYWITINEPSGVAAGGFIEGSFPPGRLLDFDAFKLAYENIAYGHARAYDALRAADTRDADGDGLATQISFATHNRLWLPLEASREEDVRGAKRVRYISGLTHLDAAVCGNVDRNLDARLDAGRDRIGDASLKGRLDFIALNFYGTSYASGLDLEPYLALPVLSNSATTRPRNDMGWDLAPESLIAVLDELKPYGLPIYVTENGLADAADNRRPKFMVDTLATIAWANKNGHDVRGYYHWTLLDNFEWAHGFCPRFGLFEVDFSDATRPRREREGARVYKQIIAKRAVAPELRGKYSYGDAVICR